MAYTGTGTDVDPFVVSTFADFLTCVGSVGGGAGAYVKVACDLDAAAEGYEYIDPIVVEAARVYADETVCIKNVTVVGVNMLKYGTGSTAHMMYFEKIHFQNWVLKNDTTSTAVLFNLARSNSCFAYFEDCEMNIEAQGGGRQFTFVQNATIYHCSVWVEVYDSTGVTILAANQYSQNAFVKSNLYFRFHSSTMVGSGNFMTSLSYSGVILDGLTISRTSVTTFCNNGSGFGYVVFKDCTVSTTCALTSPKTTNLICLENTSGITSSASPIVTPEQLKSESYLQSIGWLP